MKKVLVCSEKHGIRVFDVSTNELKDVAYKNLFTMRQKEHLYSDLLRCDSNIYKKAKEGDTKSIRTVIALHNDYEYERTEEVEVDEV